MENFLLTAFTVSVRPLAIPVCVKVVKHPRSQLVASYFVFVTILAAVAGGLISASIWLSSLFGLMVYASSLEAFIALIALALVLAFLAARWQIKKPPIVAQPI